MTGPGSRPGCCRIKNIQIQLLLLPDLKPDPDLVMVEPKMLQNLDIESKAVAAGSKILHAIRSSSGSRSDLSHTQETMYIVQDNTLSHFSLLVFVFIYFFMPMFLLTFTIALNILTCYFFLLFLSFLVIS